MYGKASISAQRNRANNVGEGAYALPNTNGAEERNEICHD